MSTASVPATQEVGRIFLDCSSEKLEKMAGYIHSCFVKLNNETIWKRSSPVENSLGNLVLHLCGNVRQWIGSFVGGLPDVRVRPDEFAAREGLTRDQLLAKLDETVQMAVQIIRNVAPDRLPVTIPVQDGQTATILEAIYHVIGHFQQHTGQIVFATKQFTSADLGLYKPAVDRAVIP